MPTLGHGHVCPWHRCSHSVTRTMAWAGADTGMHMHSQVCTCTAGCVHAQPRVYMQHHGRCKGSTARSHRGSGKPALARNAHALYTYTNSIFPLSQHPEVQINCHAHTPASPPDSDHCCLCPEGMGCAESSHLCLPLCALISLSTGLCWGRAG